MTGLNAIELIRQHHPNMSTGECILHLNEGMKDFCRRTNIFKTSYTQDSVAGKRYYTLHDDILDIQEVHFNDVKIPRLLTPPLIDDDEFVSGTNPLETPSNTSNNRAWYENTRRIGIVEKSTGALIKRDDKSTDWQSCSVTGVEIRILATAYPTLFTQASGSSNIETLEVLALVPGSFEKCIVDYVIAQGYILPQNLNPDLHMLFDQKYAIGVGEGRKFSYKSPDGTGRIVPCDF
tara:strand:+ start:493 stop:1197 length:705 start_codon:yes stop_codon:yes gene_type:complete